MFPSSAASGHVPSHGQGNLLVEDQLMISFYSQQLLFPNMSHEYLNSSPNPLLDQQPISSCNCNNPPPTTHPQHDDDDDDDDDAISLGDQYCGGAPSNCQISLGNNIQCWPWIITSEEAINKDHCGGGGDVGSSINVEGVMVANSVRRKKKVVKTGGRRKMREPRFCFKTMSEGVDVLDDGYKWRKYGQKTVKDTHHPRSYYRCTRDTCRVKKRVERLAEDPRMVITTYEGRHIHSPPDVDRDDVFLQASSQNNFFRSVASSLTMNSEQPEKHMYT